MTHIVLSALSEKMKKANEGVDALIGLPVLIKRPSR